MASSLPMWRYFTKGRSLFFAATVLVYAGLWFLTDSLGSPQVRSTAIQAMHVPPGFTDISTGAGSATGRFYYCSSRTYAPLLIRADYGWSGGKLDGDGGSALHFWFFGSSFRIRELEHWAE